MRRQKRDPEGRSHQVCVRLNDAEKEAIYGRAEASGLSVPFLLRSLGTDSPVLSGAERRALIAGLVGARRQLVGAATNVNQLAHWSNSRFEAPGESKLDTVLNDLAVVLERVESALDDLGGI